MGEPLVSDGEGVVALSFSANMQYVRPVRHFIHALCLLAEYEDSETQAIELVATEILNNSIEHGSSGPADEIAVLMRVTTAEFCFQVTDPGRGGAEFADSALSRADHMPEIEQPRGRGLFLIHQFMDELDVTWEPDRGTRTIVSKARTP